MLVWLVPFVPSVLPVPEKVPSEAIPDGVQPDMPSICAPTAADTPMVPGRPIRFCRALCAR